MSVGDDVPPIYNLFDIAVPAAIALKQVDDELKKDVLELVLRCMKKFLHGEKYWALYELVWLHDMYECDICTIRQLQKGSLLLVNAVECIGTAEQYKILYYEFARIIKG